MKRTAAIIGPTPAFLRWAIRYPCELRELEPENLPATTFRQLRSIKELDLAIRERRVFKEVAFHADTKSGKDLIGFLPSEVLGACGGQQTVEASCSGCPANMVQDVRGWAGCFGMAKLESMEHIEQFQSAIERLGKGREFAESFESTRPAWFGIWMSSSLSTRQLEILASILEVLDWGPEWSEVRRALKRCLKHDLSFHADYYPAGNSDGLRWRLNPHCDLCKFEVEDSQRSCPCCGASVLGQARKSRRVLGTRPYMQMKHIVGEATAAELVKEYLAWKKARPVDEA